MDLVYMPEVLTYGSFRSPIYRDYEQPWNRNYFHDGKSMSNQTTRQQQEQLQQQQSRGNQKDQCHLCKESKHRSLGTYIRRRSRTTSCGEIHEVKEEEEEEKQEDGQQEQTEIEAEQEKNVKIDKVNEINTHSNERKILVTENSTKNTRNKSKDTLQERKTDKFSFLDIKKSIYRLNKTAIK